MKKMMYFFNGKYSRFTLILKNNNQIVSICDDNVDENYDENGIDNSVSDDKRIKLVMILVKVMGMKIVLIFLK